MSSKLVRDGPRPAGGGHHRGVVGDAGVANEYGELLESKWIGHSRKIARKHYYQITDDDFAEAAAEPNGLHEGLHEGLQKWLLQGAAASPPTRWPGLSNP